MDKDVEKIRRAYEKGYDYRKQKKGEKVVDWIILRENDTRIKVAELSSDGYIRFIWFEKENDYSTRYGRFTHMPKDLMRKFVGKMILKGWL